MARVVTFPEVDKSCCLGCRRETENKDQCITMGCMRLIRWQMKRGHIDKDLPPVDSKDVDTPYKPTRVKTSRGKGLEKALTNLTEG